MSEARLDPTAADSPDPVVAPLLRAALALPDASLVIGRRHALCEFKTDQLEPGLARWEEEGHVSWQIGPFEGHHCHLAVDRVTRVVFAAEPTGCQGGRMNWTIWFEEETDAGTPWRSRASFSITLNRPWEDDGRPRRAVIDPVLDLWRRFGEEPFVEAEPGFLATLPG